MLELADLADLYNSVDVSNLQTKIELREQKANLSRMPITVWSTYMSLWSGSNQRTCYGDNRFGTEDLEEG
jgi:hypothetical protein